MEPLDGHTGCVESKRKPAATYGMTSSLARSVKRMPHWPCSRLDTWWMLSLHSSSLVRPKATAMTRFLPRKNLCGPSRVRALVIDSTALDIVDFQRNTLPGCVARQFRPTGKNGYGPRYTGRLTEVAPDRLQHPKI